jgi:hypothetical protein
MSIQSVHSGARPAGGEGRLRPGGALPDPVVEIVRVVVAPSEPLGVTEAGEKLQAAPVGRVPQVNDTAALNPPTGVTVMV